MAMTIAGDGLCLMSFMTLPSATAAGLPLGCGDGDSLPPSFSVVKSRTVHKEKPSEAKAVEALARDYRAAYPSFPGSLEDDLDALVVHLRFPSEHRKRIRSTNLLERTFVEVRRRAAARDRHQRGGDRRLR
jgi:hypothetical protein